MDASILPDTRFVGQQSISVAQRVYGHNGIDDNRDKNIENNNNGNNNNNNNNNNAVSHSLCGAAVNCQ